MTSIRRPQCRKRVNVNEPRNILHIFLGDPVNVFCFSFVCFTEYSRYVLIKRTPCEPVLQGKEFDPCKWVLVLTSITYHPFSGWLSVFCGYSGLLLPFSVCLSVCLSVSLSLSLSLSQSLSVCPVSYTHLTLPTKIGV